jgi:Na+(H+)/acetate symporter ActP
MGVGHIYVGKVGKGLSLIIAGVILGLLTWGSFITGLVTFGLGFIASALFGLILFALWVWQMYDAYVLANLFNRRVQETGTAPW